MTRGRSFLDIYLESTCESTLQKIGIIHVLYLYVDLVQIMSHFLGFRTGGSRKNSSTGT